MIAGVDPLTFHGALSARAAVTLSGTRLSLASLVGHPFDRNTLKLFAVTSDPVRNHVFIAGILSQYVSVVHGLHSQTPLAPTDVVRTHDTGITESSYKNLAVDPDVNRLYVRDTLSSPQTLSAMNLDTGAVLGRINLPDGLGGVVAARGLVYITTTEYPGFRIFDGATLAQQDSISSMGTALLSTVYVREDDPTQDKLYLLDSSSAAGRIYELPLATRVPTAITFDVIGSSAPHTLARSRASGRFYVASGRFLLELSSAGELVRALSLPTLLFQDMAFNDADGRLLVLFLEHPENGEIAASGARLYAYSGTAVSEIAEFGRKPHTIHVNSATGRFYCAAGDDSTVWWGSAHSDIVNPMRVGDSVEHMVASPADGTLYMNSRLGGSYLAAYNPITGTATPFTAGTWPTGFVIDPSGQCLYVLNAWDSNISVFELPSRTLLFTIEIGLPRGTTDRLPDFAVDFTRQRAYAAYPEFGQVAVVDLAARKPLSPFTVTGFIGGDIDGGPHQIQIAVCESAARLLVMSPSLQRLDVYNIEGTPSFQQSQTLPSSVTQTGGRPGWKLLFVDDERKRAFVADAERSAETGELTGGVLSPGQRVFAADSVRNLYWTGAMEEGTINIYTFDRTSLSAVERYAAGAADALAPDFELDSARGRLFVSHLATAQFDSYTLPVSFTDHPLLVQATTVKRVHVTEMRDAINTVRVRYGLGAAAWTDSITAQSTSVKAVHLTEMRTALAAVYTVRGVTPPTYTNATISARASVVKAVDVSELRAAIVVIQ